MSKKKSFTRWNISVANALDEALEEAVRLDTHSTKSDFVRDAVRRRLEEMGFKPRPFENTKTASTKTVAQKSSESNSGSMNPSVSLTDMSLKGQTKAVHTHARFNL